MKSLFDQIGPEKLRELVNCFYDIVFNESEIRELFGANPIEIREKQYKFLTQFLGGPSLYSMEYGHPKMRIRHLPHRIDNRAKDEWLRCMKQAIHRTIQDDKLRSELYACFPKIAEHMVNS